MKNDLDEGAPQRRALTVGGHGLSDLWEQCFQLRKPRPLDILHRKCLKPGFTITEFKASSSKLFPGGRSSLKTAYSYEKKNRTLKRGHFRQLPTTGEGHVRQSRGPKPRPVT